MLVLQCSISLHIFTWVGVAQSVDDLAEKQKVLGSSPVCRQSLLDFAQGNLEQDTKRLREELATPPYFLSTCLYAAGISSSSRSATLHGT